ncbi:unnamed protein product [Macrosiphum euphorbiae]|uniref:CCHC-type domain-containing protein n=1 Tax=Macrosiphum euphorbiae TaxID=13131 RepID=A0AAV0WA92_9HEMI|nr:unnamed protein product [Macrosiphum euphorbiae]
MGDHTPPTNIQHIQAPTYNELFNLAQSLKSRLELLEKNAGNPVMTQPPTQQTENSVPHSYSDYRMLPDLNRTVPEFTGHESSCAAEDWLSTVDALAGINNWPTPYRLQFVKSNMMNAARSWYHTEVFTDWSDFKVKFRSAFVRTLRMTDRWKALSERLQGETEHIADYFYDKLRLCQALHLTFTETRDHIVMGIRSQELAVYAMSRDHSTTATLLADLQEWQRLYELRRTQFPTTARPHVVPAAKTTKYEQRNTDTRRTADETPSTSATPSEGPTTSSELPKTSTVRCYNCGGTGHISRDCPKPRKPCSGCQSTTHSRGQCTVNPRKVAPPAEIYCVELTSRYPKENCFMKDILFNDIRATCLIDTGSSDVLVRISLAERSTSEIRKVCRPLVTVGDTNSPGAVTLGETTADIAVDNASAADHPVLVVSDDSIPVDVIVGRTWLNLPHISYYKRQDELVIETLNGFNSTALSENVSEESTNVYAALVSADKPTMTPLLHTDVKIDPGVTEAERGSLMTLINEDRDVFAKTLAELNCTDVMKMNIDEVQGSDLVCQKPYRTSPTDRRITAQILNDWKSAGVVSDSTLPYASPVLLVNKGTGEKRLCVDYRRLNQHTQNQPYPMPDIDDLLSRLAESRIFSTMDLSNGLLQIPRSEEAKEKTAFVTEETTARFERMPFGLKGAPGTLQRNMNTVSRGVIQPGQKVHAIKTFPQPRDAHELTGKDVAYERGRSRRRRWRCPT